MVQEDVQAMTEETHAAQQTVIYVGGAHGVTRSGLTGLVVQEEVKRIAGETSRAAFTLTCRAWCRTKYRAWPKRRTRRSKPSYTSQARMA